MKLKFPTDKYSETARDIKNAIKKGASAVCTIDKEGADKNREESLKNIPTKRGMIEMNSLWLCVKKAVQEPI